MPQIEFTQRFHDKINKINFAEIEQLGKNESIIDYITNRLNGLSEDNIGRILGIKDRIIYKYRINRIRVAIYIDSAENECVWWVVDIGKRKNEAKDDFYQGIIDRYNSESNSSDFLLPNNLDYKILQTTKQEILQKREKIELVEKYKSSLRNASIPYMMNLRGSLLEMITVKNHKDPEETYISISSLENKDSYIDINIYIMIDEYLPQMQGTCETNHQGKLIKKSNKFDMVYICLSDDSYSSF